MKVIVIIVTYNGMRWYQKCFNSLRESTIPLEVVVIDNNSSDGTLAYIKDNYPEIKLIESNNNLGFGKANNIGMQYARDNKADYIYLLNQDAWIKPDTIEVLIKQNKKHPEYGVLSPLQINALENRIDTDAPWYFLPDRCPDLISDLFFNKIEEDKLYPIKFINAAHWLISRKCFTDIGGFDPLFPHYGEDENYLYRVRFHDYKVGVYPFAHAIHDKNEEERKIQTTKQLLSREFVSNLIILSNIYDTFGRCLKNIIIQFATVFTTHIVNFLFKKAFINIIGLTKALFYLPAILKSRKKSKIKGFTHL